MPGTHLGFFHMVRSVMRRTATALTAALVAAALSSCGGEAAQVRRLDSPVAQERFQAALWLAEHDCDAALPSLIASLEDKDPSVRWVAIQALRERAGETFGYRPGDSEPRRAKAVERWRGWWEETQGGQ